MKRIEAIKAMIQALVLLSSLKDLAKKNGKTYLVEEIDKVSELLRKALEKDA